MLETIPAEILAQIGYHLSSENLQPPVSLLCTSRHLNQHLSPATNPNLYARVFKDRFDTSCIHRRLETSISNDGSKRRQFDGEGLSKELECRVRALGRLGTTPAREVEDRDTWVLYLLVIEHGESATTLH